MDSDHSSNKRLKSSSGAPIKPLALTAGAANLPAYNPPAAVAARPSSTRPTASIARQANGKTSLRLTVKAPPSKLRQATSGGSSSIPPNPYAANDDTGEDSDATPAPSARVARATRNPKTVVEPESEEGEDQEEDEEGEGEDVDRELLDNEDSEEGEEGEDDEDEDEDEDDEEMEETQEDHPPPPTIKVHPTAHQTMNRPNVTVTAPEEGPMKSVEDKEMEDDDDEEELSELDSNDELEGEGEEEEEEEEEEDSDSDSQDPSRSATPDLSKLTRRQRGPYEEADASLMALSNEAQKKKHLTAEEHAMRRAEMARRRKNLSEKRNEEEKMDTINKLLQKPAPKRRTRAEIIAQHHKDLMSTPGADDGDEERPDPVFARYVQSVEGSRLGVPIEWMESGFGEMFRGVPSREGGSAVIASGRMVEEVA